jgi:hypothetical protein
LTRKNHKDTQNLKANPVYTSPTQVTGENETKEVLINTFDEDRVSALNETYGAQLDIEEHVYDLSSLFENYSTTITVVEGVQEILSATYDTLQSDIYARIDLYNSYQKPANETVNEINPNLFTETIYNYTNFDEIEAYTYFINPQGIIGDDNIAFLRVGQKVLRKRGDWTPGTLYLKNDFVIQLGVDGAEDGNGIEFVCISQDPNFISNVAPVLDVMNWAPVKYIPIYVRDEFKAVLISGSVSLVSKYSSLDPVHEYRPVHYHFTRDRLIATQNRLWLGCKQSGSTTTDGKDPIEIIFSQDSNLYVKNPDAIQPPEDQTGPILDVR